MFSEWNRFIGIANKKVDVFSAVVAMAEANDDFVIGYICQSKLSDNPCFLHMSPGGCPRLMNRSLELLNLS